MVIILKTVIFLFNVGLALVFKSLFSDWKETKKSDSYMDSTTPWEKIKFNTIFYSIFFCMITVFMFFIIFIISNIQVSFPW